MTNYILRSESAIYYECGYSCDNAIFLRLGHEAFFITDGRYTAEARETIKNSQVIEASDLARAAQEIIKKSGIKRLFFDPKEWSLDSYEKLRSKLKTTFHPKPDFSPKKRMVKTKEEIALICEAIKKGRDGFNRFAAYLEEFGEGKTEKNLHFEAMTIMSDAGERELSFDPIVAIGENGAKPHARPTTRRLNPGDLILFDAGVKYKRYCSDRTRTARFGSPMNWEEDQKFFDSLVQKAYDAVRRAHDEAIAKARCGMKASQIDKIARDVIEEAGFGSLFVHSTGHGVGLDIHEYPYINARSETLIEENMVFTIEPGIYLPGRFGIRIEDVVVMKSSGAVLL